MKELLHKILNRLEGAKKVVFMGIGEEKLSDDGVGPYIISEFLTASNEKFLFINAAIDPMNRLDEIINFQTSHLIILDTCTLKKPPGTIAIIERQNIHESVPISSHTIPIHIVIDLLAEKLPDIKVFMIGFVPESLEGFSQLTLYKENEITLEERSENEDIPFFDINLSDTVQKAADEVIMIIKEIINIL
ncbi:MAG: hydrogenase maturation protease [Candidatus Hermodarchaeota archaeon]